ncbi:MAG: hypothetical protein FWF77_09195 [Defluviitaleaceae bacterium]|nr:hypothetical protein [Defluviitaleaceae bacterium]
MKKARQARIGHRGHVSESARALEAGSSFLAHKKKSRRVSLADSFLRNQNYFFTLKRRKTAVFYGVAAFAH